MVILSYILFIITLEKNLIIIHFTKFKNLESIMQFNNLKKILFT